jgi:hypothetical protein
MSVTALGNDKAQVMRPLVRAILVVGALGMFLLSALFIGGAPADSPWRGLVGQLWPWADSPLSYYFLAAMQAAIAAAMLWIGLSGELAALAPGALNLVVMMAGCAISFYTISLELRRSADLDDQVLSRQIFAFAVGCGLFALFNIWLYVWSRRLPFQNHQPLPRLLRISYVIFALVLATVGLALLPGRYAILPWTFGEDNRFTPVIFGWMFFGDAFYFLFAVFVPRWRAACAQLCSFLAYDLVLLGPFLIRWPWFDQWFLPEQRWLPPALHDNLLVYSLVLIYSGAVGVYYLFIDRRTRLVARGD